MDPLTISLLGSLADKAGPLIAGLFAHPQNPQEQLDMLIKALERHTETQRRAAVDAARTGGQSLEQNFRATLGESGVGSTGVGAIGRGISGSFASEAVNRANADYNKMIFDTATNLYGTGQFSRQGRYEQFLSGLGTQIAGGQNPFGEAVTGALNFANDRRNKGGTANFANNQRRRLQSGRARYSFFNPDDARNPAPPSPQLSF